MIRDTQQYDTAAPLLVNGDFRRVTAPPDDSDLEGGNEEPTEIDSEME